MHCKSGNPRAFHWYIPIVEMPTHGSNGWSAVTAPAYKGVFAGHSTPLACHSISPPFHRQTLHPYWRIRPLLEGGAFCSPSQRSCGRGILDYPSSVRQSVRPFALNQSIRISLINHMEGPLTFACKSSWKDWQAWYILHYHLIISVLYRAISWNIGKLLCFFFHIHQRLLSGIFCVRDSHGLARER